MALDVQPFGHHEEGWWAGRLTRRSRELGAYRAFRMFVPERIEALDVAPPLDLAQRLAEAEAALARLDASAEARALGALTPLLARQESIASSWIEGLEVGYRQLAAASVRPEEQGETARGVLGNLEAMRQATALGSRPAVEVAGILDLHRALMERAPEPWPALAGRTRTGVVWIGPPGSTPLDAEYVAPPARLVPDLLADLVGFVNRSDVPTLMQAAIAHAQFEAIHPFADGNGRVGRCLIHVVLSRAGLSTVVVPISSAFAADRRGYLEGLSAYQRGELGRWLDVFLGAVEAAAAQVAELERELVQLRSRWDDRLRARGVRSDAADWRLLDVLLAQPVVDAGTAVAALEVSHPTATGALQRLEGDGIVVAGDRRWRREWTATEVIELMVLIEQRLRVNSAEM